MLLLLYTGAIIVVLMFLPLHSASPPPPLSGAPPGSVNALTLVGDKANVQKSQRDTEREREGEREEKVAGRGIRGKKMYVCV